MKYHFKVHKENNSFWAECIELEGCVTEADTVQDLEVMAEEALDLYLNECLDSKLPPYPLPNIKLDGDETLLQIPVSPDRAFVTLLRDFRRMKNLTQIEMTQALGMKNRNSYVKLEKKGNPTIKTIGKFLKAFPDFPIKQCFPVYS